MPEFKQEQKFSAVEFSKLLTARISQEVARKLRDQVDGGGDALRFSIDSGRVIASASAEQENMSPEGRLPQIPPR